MFLDQLDDVMAIHTPDQLRHKVGGPCYIKCSVVCFWRRWLGRLFGSIGVDKVHRIELLIAMDVSYLVQWVYRAT